MSSLYRRPTSGASGHSHHQTPDHFLRQVRHPDPTSTDVSVRLPPLNISGSNANYTKAHADDQFQSLRGIPSPPYSDCSRDYIPQKGGSQYQHAMAAPSWDRQSPPYAPKAWASPASQPLTPTPIPSEPASHSMPSPYTTRSEYQQSTYCPPPYGSAGMPAPSQLLGTQSYTAYSHQVPYRSAPTYQAQPAFGSRFSDYPSISYPTNYPSASIVSHQIPTVPLNWPSSACAQPYQQSPQVNHQPAANRLPRSPSALGGLTSEAWQIIFRYLPYADRLRLRSVNHFFNDTLVALEDHLNALAHPDPADIADKIGLVASAENYRKHWAPSLAAEARSTNRGRPRNDQKALRTDTDATKTGGTKTGRRKREAEAASIGNLGCYHCYRVLPGEEFCREPSRYDVNGIGRDMVATGVSIAPRRYCLKCGIKKGFHLPDKYYERKVGVSIWVCRCGTINEDGVMHCEKCENMCPFTSVERQKGEDG